MNKIYSAAAAATLILLLSGANDAGAQDRDRQRNPATDQDRVSNQQRMQNQDRDRSADQDRLQDRDPDFASERARDREQLHIRDREELHNRDIYGSELMTRQERREYRNRIGEMSNVQEWARYRAEHDNRMMARARERATDLPAPLYGQQLMTDQERRNLRSRLENASTEQERQRIQAENRQMMQERAREHQIPLSELE